ncbi:hypothetical protein [Methylorubrum extorquens]
MPTRTLGFDTTIRDIVDTLQSPIEYVRRVLANFYECGIDREHGRVRIGVCGEGIRPNYKIEVPGLTLDRYFTFSGLSHKQVRQHVPAMLYETWSDGSMSLHEVGELLGRLRKQTPTKT